MRVVGPLSEGGMDVLRPDTLGRPASRQLGPSPVRDSWMAPPDLWRWAARLARVDFEELPLIHLSRIWPGASPNHGLRGRGGSLLQCPQGGGSRAGGVGIWRHFSPAEVAFTRVSYWLRGMDFGGDGPEIVRNWNRSEALQVSVGHTKRASGVLGRCRAGGD